jgi:AP endonuclease-2
MFENGERRQEYTAKLLLPTSGRLIPEFDKRRSIKDMFSRKPTNTSLSSSTASKLTPSVSSQDKDQSIVVVGTSASGAFSSSSRPITDGSLAAKSTVRKRSEKSDLTPSVKRSKSMASQTTAPSTPGQKSLKGFFKTKAAVTDQKNDTDVQGSALQAIGRSSGFHSIPVISQPENKEDLHSAISIPGDSPDEPDTFVPAKAGQDSESIIDPIISKEDWSRLFTKRPVPKCDGHQEPCISLTTKKPGVNCGRSFWICPRPLGPSGNKEKGTQWRCPTFIWASDWNS